MMVVVTGVSGSGKSTLVHDVIFRSLEALHKSRERGGGSAAGNWIPPRMARGRALMCRKVEGAERITDHGDDRPIAHRAHAALEPGDLHQGVRPDPRALRRHAARARSAATRPDISRSTFPAGAARSARATARSRWRCSSWRTWNWCARSARARATRAAFWNQVQRPEHPRGAATHGARGHGFFHAAPRLVQRLKVLDDVGLGYLRLGQSATTLSGGEAQRVKLAAHLASASCAGTLFICDEPTTGLHFDDIAKLLETFQTADRERRQPADHRAQSGRDQGGGLGDRSGTGRRRRGRAHRGVGSAGGDRAGDRRLHGAVSARRNGAVKQRISSSRSFLAFLPLVSSWFFSAFSSASLRLCGEGFEFRDLNLHRGGSAPPL